MAKIVTSEYALDLQYTPFENMGDDEFYHFCEQNKHIPIERDENHQIIFMPPVTSAFSGKNSDIIIDKGIWNRKLKAGMLYESSAGFYLPDTSMRSPDAAPISVNAGMHWAKCNEKASPTLCQILW